MICVDYASSIETISFLNKLCHKTVNRIYASNDRGPKILVRMAYLLASRFLFFIVWKAGKDI